MVSNLDERDLYDPRSCGTKKSCLLQRIRISTRKLQSKCFTNLGAQETVWESDQISCDAMVK